MPIKIYTHTHTDILDQAKISHKQKPLKIEIKVKSSIYKCLMVQDFIALQ